MAALTSWAGEAATVNHAASLEVADAKSARDALGRTNSAAADFQAL
jgi:hypothetical protein